MICGGKTRDISWSNGTWLILDIGFAKTKNPSCGLLIHVPKQKEDEKIKAYTFNEAVNKVIEAARKNKTLNLVIEAPLSVAFDKDGNPTGRSIDKQGSKPRYWYQQAGCVVMVATLHLMRSLISAKPDSEIRLFEGFVSFKPKDGKSKKQNSHLKDIERLREVMRNPKKFASCIHDPTKLRKNSSDTIESTFKVAGWDFVGVPPVIMPNDR
jgi:hypothetical protein